jgi:hypothetical protein
MASQDDDPEARIRELERSLADVARASELGTAQPSYVPVPPAQYNAGAPSLPPMPAPYQNAYAAPQYAPPRRYRALPFIFAGIVVCMLAVGVLVAVSGRMMSPGGSMSRLIDTTITASPGTQVSASGVDETKHFVCNDGSVSVSGVRNTVTVTGHCIKVTVSGVSNHVTLETADAITASGVQNQITYHSGEPKIENSGGDNSVQQG